MTADDALYALRAHDERFVSIDYRSVGGIDEEWRANCPVCAARGALRLRELDRGAPVELICGRGCDPKTIEAKLRERLMLESRPRPRIAWTFREPKSGVRDLSGLRALASRDYVERLTDRRPSHAGFVRCPFHGGGQERSPSLHVGDAPGWYCFGCHRGGNVLDFYAELNSMGVPSGRDFGRFVDGLADALGVAVA